jgi:hypothetical protein
MVHVHILFNWELGMFGMVLWAAIGSWARCVGNDTYREYRKIGCNRGSGFVAYALLCLFVLYSVIILSMKMLLLGM